MQFLKQTVKDKLTLRANGSGCLTWHCNTAFKLHDDFRSHTGSTFLIGDGAITSLSRKQGMSKRSSTKVEVVAADKIISPMIWTHIFLKAQGYPVKENILYQDNKRGHVAQDQQMQECWQVLLSFEHLVLLHYQSKGQRSH